jgi:DNA-binding response OmpR family regulator
MLDERSGETLAAGELVVRPGEFIAIARGEVLPLSRRELQLLATLARNPGRVISREDLFEMVWGGRLEPGDRSVDVYVHKLRTKLASRLPEWSFIHTHFGFGYRFQAERSRVENNLATTA